jgi:hypothetical protein
MSSHPYFEIARARQNEIATRTIHAHHRSDIDAINGPRRPVAHRIGQAVAALGVCLVATTAVAISGADANSRPAKASRHTSAAQLAQKIAALEAKGYVQTSCTVGGTLMSDYRTGQSVLVTW